MIAMHTSPLSPKSIAKRCSRNSEKASAIGLGERVRVRGKVTRDSAPHPDPLPMSGRENNWNLFSRPLMGRGDTTILYFRR